MSLKYIQCVISKRWLCHRVIWANILYQEQVSFLVNCHSLIAPRDSAQRAEETLTTETLPTVIGQQKITMLGPVWCDNLTYKHCQVLSLTTFITFTLLTVTTAVKPHFINTNLHQLSSPILLLSSVFQKLNCIQNKPVWLKTLSTMTKRSLFLRHPHHTESGTCPLRSWVRLPVTGSGRDWVHYNMLSYHIISFKHLKNH